MDDEKLDGGLSELTDLLGKEEAEKLLSGPIDIGEITRRECEIRRLKADLREKQFILAELTRIESGISQREAEIVDMRKRAEALLASLETNG